MTLQIYIPFPGHIPSEVTKTYGQRWLELNKVDGEIIRADQTIVAEVNHNQIYKLCESYVHEWSVEDLRSYSEFREQNIRSTMWLFSPQSREVSLILEYVDECEDEIIEYLTANGVIDYED